MAHLVIQTGSDEKIYELTRSIVTVGRGLANNIAIDDKKLSRNHCSVRTTEDGYQVEDSGSVNGTYLNGKRIDKAVLADGDVVNIGMVRITFERSFSTERTNDDTQQLRDIVSTALVGEIDAVSKDEPDGLIRDMQMDALLRERDYLRGLQEIVKALNSETDLETLLARVVDSAIQLAGAKRGFVILSERDRMKFEIARGAGHRNLDTTEFEVSKTIANEVMKSGEMLIVQDAQEDERFREHRSVVGYQLSSIICIPLKMKGEVVGVLYIDTPEKGRYFTEEDRMQLSALADHASIAVHNVALYNENLERRRELQVEKEHVEKLNLLLEEKIEREQERAVSAEEHLADVTAELKLKYNYANIIGKSAPMQKMYRLLDKTTDTEFPVLIQGESGTGKELVARAIHFNGPRKDARFVSENVSAIAPSLLESELFGHVRGAFTGAVKDKKGLFEVADGGTIFLDEMAEMPAEMQKKLLRVLQDGELRRVGGKERIRVDVRVICATNANLKEKVDAGGFREDLFYRVNVINLTLPPLRERRGDIPLLVGRFLDEIAETSGEERMSIPDKVMTCLANYHWPGNVRELRNEIEKLVALSDSTISIETLSPHIREAGDAAYRKKAKEASVVGMKLRDVEKYLIEETLKYYGGKKVVVADVLGIPRKTLYNKLKKHNISL